MRHKNTHGRLNRTASHRKALFMNMTQALLQHEQIRTTLPKAKALRPVVEKLITKAKRGSVSDHRVVYSMIQDGPVTKKLFAELATRYANRPGGYTRVLRAGFRYGDAAPMAVIELVDRNADARGAADKARVEAERVDDTEE